MSKTRGLGRRSESGTIGGRWVVMYIYALLVSGSDLTKQTVVVRPNRRASGKWGEIEV